jgi:tRNA (adenine-N(1)-)-methyltransferase non-catalytic subunit
LADQVQEEVRGGFDSLVVGGTLHPNLVMPTLVKQLRPSSPFVVYCQFVQPLLETMETLIKGDECADMCISETWMREYQVLPGRTHPNMHMTSASGFLLTGCKVVRNVEKPPPVPNKPKWGDEGYQGGGKKQRKE